MSDNGEFNVLNMDDNTDNNINDDKDEELSVYFGSDIVLDISSDSILTLDSELEDSDDGFEEQSLRDTENGCNEDNGADRDDEEDDNENVEENLLPANFRRCNPSSVNVSSKNKRRKPSIIEDFKRLQELLEMTSKRITHIYETVSNMQDYELSPMEKYENCRVSLSETEQATQGQDNPEGTVAQPVAEAEPEKLVSDLDIVPINEDAQRIDNVIISSEQPAVEAPLAFLQPVDSIQANDVNGMIYPAVVGVENISANNGSLFVYIPPNLEIPEIAEASVENHILTVNNPTFEENHKEEETFNPPVFHEFDIPVIPEEIVEDNPETVNYPAPIVNSSGQQNSSSFVRPPSDSEIEEVVLVEMPKKKEVIVDGNKQTVYSPALLGNVVPPDPETIAASVSTETVIEKLVLVEVQVDPENIVDNNSETLNNPIIPENDGNQEPAAASFVPSESEFDNVFPIEMFQTEAIPEVIPQVVNCPTSTEHINDEEEYLGDPRRNIRLPNFHLVTAKNKPTASYAACYLASLIFSEEILLLNSFAGYISRKFMDHNKMSAIREYLSTIFPNCDLREQGKDWVDCLSAINFMIESLYTEVEKHTDKNESVPISTDWNIRSGEDEDEVPSQWFQEVRNSVIRESENYEQNASANSEGTDNTAIIPDELVYLGDPSRNIQIPYSVLKVAKDQLLPYVSAKYIILHLFPEEILIKSNVYGNMECGLFALDPNRIGALKEFLQNNYPEHDLEETGCGWKVCMTAINSSLQTLRQSPRNVIA